MVSGTDGDWHSIYDPVDFGRDELGRAVRLTLAYRSLLVGGEPDGGKSNALQLVVSHVAFASDAVLYCFDPKIVELARWRNIAAAFVATEIAEAVEVLRELQYQMEQRNPALRDANRRKVERGDGTSLLVLVIDEASFFLTHPNKRSAQEFAELLRDLVGRGRAGGIVVVLSASKPSGDVMMTSLRDLIAYRFALRLPTKDASDTILGAGMAADGFSAADIDLGAPGVGWLVREGGRPVLCRTHYLRDGDLTALVTGSLQLQRSR